MSRARQGIFRAAAVFLPILLLIMTPTVGIWLSIVRQGQVSAQIQAALSNENVRSGLSIELADSLISGLDKKTKVLVRPQKEILASAISVRLADPQVQSELGAIGETVFNAVTTGAQEVRIDPAPLAEELVGAINTLAGIEKITESDLGDLEPVTLGGVDEPLPNLSSVVGALRALALAASLLTILCIVAIIRTSRTPWRGLGIPLFILGTLWVATFFIGSQILQQQLEPGLQSEVIPTLFANLFFGTRLIGLLLSFAGVALLVTHFVLRRKAESSLQTAV